MSQYTTDRQQISYRHRPLTQSHLHFSQLSALMDSLSSTMINQDTTNPESTSTQSPNFLDTAHAFNPNIVQDLESQHGSYPDILTNNTNDLIIKISNFEAELQNEHNQTILLTTTLVENQKTIEENKKNFEARFVCLEESLKGPLMPEPKPI